MNIQVIGSGCPNCRKLYEKVSGIVSNIDPQLKVEYVTDITKLIELGAMTSPALVIDGEIVFTGSGPSDEEIENFIRNNKQK